MHKNHTYIADLPATRNEFIDAVKNEKEAIVVNHRLLKELIEEINASLSAKKRGKFFKRAAIPMVLLSWNPFGWTLGGIAYFCGAFTSASNDFKKYVIYPGEDTGGLQIIVLHHKHKVDREYDEIVYPAFVKNVDYSKRNKKIRGN